MRLNHCRHGLIVGHRIVSTLLPDSIRWRFEKVFTHEPFMNIDIKGAKHVFGQQWCRLVILAVLGDLANLISLVQAQQDILLR